MARQKRMAGLLGYGVVICGGILPVTVAVMGYRGKDKNRGLGEVRQQEEYTYLADW